MHYFGGKGIIFNLQNKSLAQRHNRFFSPGTLIYFMTNLCAGGSHSPAGHFDVKSAFRVLLPPQAGVIWRFPRPIPVTHSFANGLKHTTDKEIRIIEVLFKREKSYKSKFKVSLIRSSLCVPDEDVLLLAYSLAQRLSEGHLGKVLQRCVDGVPDGLVKH